MSSAPNSMSGNMVSNVVTTTAATSSSTTSSAVSTSPCSKRQAAYARPQIDLIVESKFNELAKKIFDELQQVQYSNEFLRAIDGIIKEPIERNLKFSASNSKINRPQQQQQRQLVANVEPVVLKQQNSINAVTNSRTNICKSNGKLVAQIQNQQQVKGSNSKNDQSSHLARLAGQKIQQEASSSLNQSNACVSSTQTKTSQQQQQQSVSQQLSRSAIPTSTVLSGINVTYPISKSASVGGDSPSRKEAKSGTSPSKTTTTATISTNNSNLDNKYVKSASHHHHSKLTPSEKLHQRRPTRATLDANDIEFLEGNSKKGLELDNGDADDDYDIDDDDEDDDDDDDDFGTTTNLNARRDYLNQKFIQPASNGPIVKSRTFSDATSFSDANVTSSNGQQVKAAIDATRCLISQTMDDKQQALGKIINSSTSTTQNSNNNITNEPLRRRHNPIVRSSTISGSSNHSSARDRLQPIKSSTQVNQDVIRMAKSPLGIAIRANNSDNNTKHQQQLRHQQQPACISNDSREPRSIEFLASHLYKPHMNYSTSVLGTHRLSDDDEIIIIPTQSPSLLSGTASPDNNTNEQLQQQQNIDELSERFSISRTKSFWEKLSNTKNAVVVGGGNSQITNAISANQAGPIVNGPNNNIKSSVAICNDTQQQQQLNPRVAATAQLLSNTDNKLSGLARQQQRQNFDRMDSTGGSNSYYSNCSSSSGDELNPIGLLQQRRDQQQQHQFGNKNNGTNGADNITANANCLRQHQHRSINNPTVSQLQQEMSRQNILRQTR